MIGEADRHLFLGEALRADELRLLRGDRRRRRAIEQAGAGDRVRTPVGMVIFELRAPARNEQPFDAAPGVPAGEQRAGRPEARRDIVGRARIDAGTGLQEAWAAADIDLQRGRHEPAGLAGRVIARGPAGADLRDGGIAGGQRRRREGHGLFIAAHRQVDGSLDPQHPITRLVIGADVGAEDEGAIVERGGRAAGVGVRLKAGPGAAVIRLQIHRRRGVEGIAAGNAEIEPGPRRRGRVDRHGRGRGLRVGEIGREGGNDHRPEQQRQREGEPREEVIKLGHD